jgi:hypothetical protein
MTDTALTETWYQNTRMRRICAVRAGQHPLRATPTIELRVSMPAPSDDPNVYHFELEQARRLGAALIDAADKAAR